MNTLVTPATAAAVEDLTAIFSDHESAVRSYCRKFPAVFDTARESILRDVDGHTYIDFLSGAGSLNYGHNHPTIKNALVDYLQRDGITHSLDLHTSAKKNFIKEFNRIILQPRGMDYRLQFTGPTGTNAVEAAMKLARKVTGRTNIVAFSNAFHGMSLGALAASARSAKRAAAGVPLPDIIRMPYEGFLGEHVDSLEVLEKMLHSPGAGIDLPAAFIVETVQAEGGVNVASGPWLARLAELAARHKILMIVDDIQAGCGRAGSFFSFERAGIQPDLICLAKSISGYGLPMSLVLIKPELDQWQPGEHNGTFRGNNLAFVAATHALQFWQDPAFIQALAENSRRIADALSHWHATWPQTIKAVRGIGMIWGIELQDCATAQALSAHAYAEGLIVETCGPQDNVIKLLPPLTIDTQTLNDGLTRLGTAMDSTAKKPNTLRSEAAGGIVSKLTSGNDANLFDLDNQLIERSLAGLTPAANKSLLAAQQRFSAALSSEGLNFEGKSYPVSIRPLILPQKVVEQLKAIGEGFARVFDNVAKIYVKNEQVRKLFPAYKNSEHLTLNLPDHSPLVRIFRLDGLFDGEGVYQILETNTDCPGGVIQNGLASQLWADIENPLLAGVEHSIDFQPFVADADLFLKEILATHLQRVGRPASRAAIVTFKGRFKNEVAQMVAGLNRLGVPTEEVDAADLSRRDGQLVDKQGRTIDVAYNKLDLRDLIDEPLVDEYLQAANAGEVTFLNPLVSQWPLADKAIMALLSDPATLALLPAQDQALCQAHIPWTRLLVEGSSTDHNGQTVNLIDYVKQHRQDLVLKPSNATRGEGLLVGPFAAQQEWEAFIQEALAGASTFVVQRYIKGHMLAAVHPDIGVTEQMWSGVDTYVYGGRFAGFQARASFDPVMNVGRRGILLPVITVKEQTR